MTAKVVAGVDVGNATTEVAIVSGGRLLGVDRLPTRGRKGSPESLRSAAALVRRLERRLGCVVDEARIAPLRAVDTATLTIPPARAPAGRLRVLTAGVATPGGTGAWVGVPLWLDAPVPPAAAPVVAVPRAAATLAAAPAATAPSAATPRAVGPPNACGSPAGASRGDSPMVAVVPAGLGYDRAAGRLRALLAAGVQVSAVLAAGDEGVLIANRLPVRLPVIDQVDVAAVAGCAYVAVEVRGPGQPMTLLADPVALAAALSLQGSEAADAVALCRTLVDYSNAVVGYAQAAAAQARPTQAAVAQARPTQAAVAQARPTQARPAQVAMVRPGAAEEAVGQPAEEGAGAGRSAEEGAAAAQRAELGTAQRAEQGAGQPGAAETAASGPECTQPEAAGLPAQSLPPVDDPRRKPWVDDHPREPWVRVGDEWIPLRTAQDRAAGWPVGAVSALASADGQTDVDDLYALNLAAVAETATARRQGLGRAALVAFLRRPPDAADHAAQLAELLGRPVRRLLSEPAAARLGALTTPGARSDAVVVDLGAGTIDVIARGGEVVAAGAGDLLSSAVAETVGIPRAAADWVKRGPCVRVDGGQRFEAEDGTRGFLDRPAPASAVGMLAAAGPTGLLPFDRAHTPAEWRAIRLRLKQAVFAVNLRRALDTLGARMPQVLIVGGPAGDDELLGVLLRSLPGEVAVGRGNVGGTLAGPPAGHRFAAALGLALWDS